MNSLGYWISIILLGFFGTAVLGLFLKWVDRFLTARIQWRKGPPIYQPVADILKLLGKETVVSERASLGLFLLAPLLSFIGTAVAACILWAVAIDPTVSFTGDLIVVVYFLVFPSLGLILAGSSSGSPHGGLGASREMKMVIGYELPFILGLVPVILGANATFQLSSILTAQATEGVTLLSVGGFLGFLCVLAAMQAKLGVVPFDQAEAETELMGGVILEYSGPPLALIHLTRSMLLFVLPMFIITVFWGGIHLTGWGLLSTIVKFLVLLVVIVLMQNTNPRLRIDQVLSFFWFIVTPVALIACVFSVAGYYA